MSEPLKGHPDGWVRSQGDSIVRIWTDDGLGRGVPLYSMVDIEYWPTKDGLKILTHAGLLVIEGPRVLDLWKDICKNRATDIRANGKGIMSVRIYEKSDEKETKDDQGKGSDVG